MPTHAYKARFLRKGTGTNDLEKTLKKAVAVLAGQGIASLVVGGYAVQESGYARYTKDIDLVVRDVEEARGYLSINGFKETTGASMTDNETGFAVLLLPAGGSVGPGPLKLPIPTEVTRTPKIADLRTLLQMKLSSRIGRPVGRAKDAADVVELIKANDLPEDFKLDPAVSAAYQKLWTDLHNEKWSTS